MPHSRYFILRQPSSRQEEKSDYSLLSLTKSKLLPQKSNRRLFLTVHWPEGSHMPIPRPIINNGQEIVLLYPVGQGMSAHIIRILLAGRKGKCSSYWHLTVSATVYKKSGVRLNIKFYCFHQFTDISSTPLYLFA